MSEEQIINRSDKLVEVYPRLRQFCDDLNASNNYPDFTFRFQEDGLFKASIYAESDNEVISEEYEDFGMQIIDLLYEAIRDTNLFDNIEIKDEYRNNYIRFNIANLNSLEAMEFKELNDEDDVEESSDFTVDTIVYMYGEDALNEMSDFVVDLYDIYHIRQKSELLFRLKREFSLNNLEAMVIYDHAKEMIDYMAECGEFDEF